VKLGKLGELPVTERGTIRWDDYMVASLRDRAEAAAYLSLCLEEGGRQDFLSAVRHVVNANGGIATVAKRTGLNREYLYKMLSPKGNPRLESLFAILTGLGFTLQVGVAPTPKKRRSTSKRKRAA
jgi:probable addiction module antidote protein